MKSIFPLHSRIADLRYKAYRLGTRIALGDLCGHALGIKLCRSLDEASAQGSIASHILRRELISEAYVQHYPFPEHYPLNFPRTEAFSERAAFLLSDVVVSPHMGSMWFQNQCFLQQSLGSIPRAFGWGGVKETLLPIRNHHEPKPVCPLSNAGYYHVLLESIPQAIHAVKHFPDTRLLVTKTPKKYLLSIIQFLGLEERVIESDYPLKVHQGVLVPRWVNGGFIPQEDVNVLREQILSRLPRKTSARTHDIYISRSKCPHRSLANEKELEQTLRRLGFDILFFEEMAFKDQMESIANARIIIAPHGSGIANIIAATPGVHLVEIVSPTWFNTCYAKLALQLGVDYTCITTAMKKQSNLIPIDEVIQRVQLPLELHEHLKCGQRLHKN